MTVTFYKLSISGVLVLLVGCSYLGELPLVGQRSSQQSEQQSEQQSKVALSSSLQACGPEAGAPFSYRKAILVAGTLGAPDIARDLPGLANLTSRRLQTHLDALDRFNVLATHDISFKSLALDTAARVRQFGQQYDSQFVVKIELEDLTLDTTGVWLSKIFVGSNERNVLIRLYIYDAEYGALFHSQQYQRTVSGDVVGYPGSGTTVTTSWFNTNLGAQIDEILKAMSVEINEKLACVPFSTVVTAVRGYEIHIKAGYLHGIRPGETLRVYRRSDVLAPDGTRELGGKQGKNEGWIEVKTVFPNYSIASATLETAGGNRLGVGDVVRAW